MDLREHYAPAVERARLKTLTRLDQHCRRFIALSPFCCLGTQTENGGDVSPRGDAPGFVHVLDDTTLALPDWPGNNRLDSLSNINANPRVALLFLVPGIAETLRVNGQARVSFEPSLMARWEVNGNHPRSVLVLQVNEAFFHCGKALLRSRLWEDAARVERSAFPPYGQVLKDQIADGVTQSAGEIQESIEHAYRTKLY